MSLAGNILRLAPLVIAVKSGWELSRMIRSRHKEQRFFNTERSYLSGALHVAYCEGIINMGDYDRWQERLTQAYYKKDSKFLKAFLIYFVLIDNRKGVEGD